MTRELQLELVALIDAILLKDNLLLEECCFMIFDILLNILSMAVDQHVMNQVNTILLNSNHRFFLFP